ncbi:MAG: monooxygenase FAD-binding protein, partial [Solirubrobacterales bacterium]|nr:monooxygenase FAD-binding protein [Solirubrobacterales bacterium]
VAPALRGEEALEKGLRRYRRSHSRHLHGHARIIHDNATGRKMQAQERVIFSGAARHPRVAAIFDAFGARQIGATKMIAVGTPLALVANARYALRHRGRVGRIGTGVGSAA